MSKPRWSWKRWEAAVEAAPLPAKTKALAGRFREVYRPNRRMQWIGPWEIEGAPGYDELRPLCAFGFVFMHQGSLQPDFDPVPLPNSIPVTRREAFILRRMLRGKWVLYHVVAPGYSIKRADRRRWIWKPAYPGMGYLPGRVLGARALLNKGLIEVTIVGHPGYEHICRPVARRLVGVRGFVRIGLRYLRDAAEGRRRRESGKGP